MSLSLEDFTVEQRRTMIALDDRFGPVPDKLGAMHEANLRVLARFGLADDDTRRLTDRGRRLLDEGEVGREFREESAGG